jgi:hypothetical protein
MVQTTVDGDTQQFELVTSPDIGEYEVLDSGSIGSVIVEKITEAIQDRGGMVGFDGVRALALHEPPAAAPRRIECIGDSMMCGAHIERTSPFSDSCSGQHGGSHTSSWLSWCPVLARKLKADYVMECCRYVYTTKHQLFPFTLL